MDSLVDYIMITAAHLGIAQYDISVLFFNDENCHQIYFRNFFNMYPIALVFLPEILSDGYV
jgi:hypothetical protein